jgi:hypothetical protein
MNVLNLRWYGVFFLAGLLVVSCAGLFETAPGYMDAEYYYAGGKNLAEGKGFWQAFIWNYLDEPEGIPQPSHTYWMPLVSLIAAVGLKISDTFRAAQAPFWLLAACISPLTVWLGMKLHGRTGWACLGGIFALLPVFYLAYLPTTDAFAIVMLLGGGIFLTVRWRTRSVWRFLGLGILTGLMHLTRADGILWFLVVLGFILYEDLTDRGSTHLNRWLHAVVLVAGYLIPMATWYARNLFLWGWFFSPGNSRSLWITSYESTFLYPAKLINFQTWWAAGLGAILMARLSALSNNLQTLLAVQGSVVLLPFILVGLWVLRRERLILLAVLIWGIIFGAMTIAFPFAGINGSFLHSSAGLQPLFWAVAPVGIDRVVNYWVRLRKIRSARNFHRFMVLLLVMMCSFLSVGIYTQRVFGSGKVMAWEADTRGFQNVVQKFAGLGIRTNDVVMINNPPGYTLVSGQPSIVIPYGDEKMVLAAAEKYHARYLVLDENNSYLLADLFLQPKDRPGFHYLGKTEATLIYEFNP